MSAPACPRDAKGRFTADAPTEPADPSVPPGMLDIGGAAERSGVPGALRCDPPGTPIRAGGLTWTAADAGPHAASIGCALALETAEGAA